MQVLRTEVKEHTQISIKEQALGILLRTMKIILDIHDLFENLSCNFFLFFTLIFFFIFSKFYFIFI